MHWVLGNHTDTDRRGPIGRIGNWNQARWKQNASAAEDRQGASPASRRAMRVL